MDFTDVLDHNNRQEGSNGVVAQETPLMLATPEIFPILDAEDLQEIFPRAIQVVAFFNEIQE